MDPFFKVIGSAAVVIAIFFVSIVAGRLIAAVAVKDTNHVRSATVLAALAIFLLLFFLFVR